MSRRFQVVGIGNALVDVLAYAEDAFLTRNGIAKGIMQLNDLDRATRLYARIGPTWEISGGSAANTIVGIALLGGRTAYVGKVKNDQLGKIFAHDLRAQGVVHETRPAPAAAEAETGRSIVLVTPDGERTMNTYLGWAEFLAPDDIDPAMMADTEWLFLEGYRFDGPDSHAAFAKAIRACKGTGGKVSITLSDPFCIKRHRAAFARMLKDDVDMLFANRAEMLAMYQTGDFDTALARAIAEIDIVVCTDSGNGAHILQGGARWHVPAVPTTIVDTTGAGDLFAAGFLWGLTGGHDFETCGRMGTVAGAEIISHTGARPEADLTALFKRHKVL